MKETLKNKIYRMNMLIWIPFVLMILMVFYIILSSRLEGQAADNLQNQSYTHQLYAMRYVKQEDFQASNRASQKTAGHLAEYISEKSGLRVQIYGVLPSGFGEGGGLSLLGDSGQEELPATKDLSLAAEQKCYSYFYKGHQKCISFCAPVYDKKSGDMERGAAVIRYIYPLQKEYRFLFRVIASIVGITVVVLCLNIFLTRLMAEKITRSIHELKLSVGKIQSGHMEYRVNIRSGDEMEELGEAFNAMQRRIQKYVNDLDTQSRQMQLFFNSAAHQLKTPLTSIIGYSQMIQVSEDPDEICEDAFIIEEAGEKLLNSINTIIAGSRYGADTRPIHSSKVRLRELARECFRLLRPRMERLHISGEILGEEDIALYTDREILKEILLTILDNALIHSQCRKITINFEVEKEQVRLEVADDGRGIDPSDREFIFKAFYQGNDSLGKGSGLGLSVCAALTGRLGGEIGLQKGEEGGSKFVIKFPRGTGT